MKKVTVLLSILLLITLAFSYEIHSNDPVLKAGIAKTDITPTESLYMGGYDSNMRAESSDGVYGSIYIRALVFDNSQTKIAFVVSDIVGYRGYDSIRNSISAGTGIPFENIFISATHNHAAPVIGGKNSESEWSKSFTKNAVETVKKALNDLEPVKIGGGTGHSSIAMNRRRKMEDTVSYFSFDENNSSQSSGKFKTNNPVLLHEMAGVYRLGSNPGGSIDDEVGIIRIDTMSGKPKAVFVNYAAHGTSLGGRNRTISPEWSGHMVEYIEENIPGVQGIFAQGAAGDINPRFVGGIDGVPESLERTARLGYEIGEEVVRVYNGITTGEPLNSRIQIVQKDIGCPLKYNHVMSDFKNTTIGVPTTVIRLDDITMVTFPGELFHKIGKQIKNSTHSRYSFLIGYCNESLGYMVTQEAYSEGGYEPNSSRYAPVAEKIYVKGVIELLNKLE